MVIAQEIIPQHQFILFSGDHGMFSNIRKINKFMYWFEKFMQSRTNDNTDTYRGYFRLIISLAGTDTILYYYTMKGVRRGFSTRYKIRIYC